MDTPMIILVEDDAVIAELLEFNLKNEGFSTHAFRDGQSLFQNLASLPEPDLFVLDLMLPGMDGFEICARLRRESKYELTPILMLTARGTENDKVRGLETGADDYLTKPFGMRELLARVRTQIRRYQKILATGAAGAAGAAGPAGSPGSAGSAGTPGSAGPAELDSGKETGLLADPTLQPAAGGIDTNIHPGQISCQDILLDDLRHRVFKAGEEIEMTNREYELLKYLMIHRGVAFSRDELLDRVWGYEYGGETRTVDVHIRQLRRKLENDDANPILIETVRGRGYRWTDQL